MIRPRAVGFVASAVVVAGLVILIARTRRADAGEGGLAAAPESVPATPSPDDAAPRVPVSAGNESAPRTAAGAQVHVHVLRHDYAAPAVGRKVFLYLRALGEAQPARVGEGETDTSGEVVFDGVAPGQVLASLHELDPVLAPPQVATAIVGPQLPEVSLTVADREPQHEVRLQVDALVDARPGQLAKLYLRELTSGACIPMPRSLVAGRQTVTWSVPAGDYVVRMVPSSAFELRPDPGILAVGHDVVQASVTLRDNPATAELTLHGIDAADFPVRVHLKNPDEPWGPDDHLIFAGPHHWYEPTQCVQAPSGPVRIVAFGRSKAYLAEPVEMAGTTLAVTLEPAAWVKISWLAGRCRHGGSVLVEASAGRRRELVALRRTMLSASAGLAPGYSGMLVATPGTLTLGCADAAGTDLWTEQRVVDPGVHDIVVRR